MLTATNSGVAGSRLRDRNEWLGCEIVVVVVVMMNLLRPKPGYHKIAAMIMVVQVEPCCGVAEPG